MRGATWRAAALVLGVLALGTAATTLPLRQLPRWISELGPYGVVVGVVIGALLLAAVVPRTAITLAAGALFGPLGGAAVSLAASMLAAVGTFAVGRTLGRELVVTRAGARLRRLDAWVARRGTLAVVVVRMLPMSTFGLVGYAYGASAVRPRHYLMGTLIGATPSAFTYALIGATVVAPDRLSLLTATPALLGLAVSAAAALWWRLDGTRAALPSTVTTTGH